jgi:hypothetical protein
MHLDEMNGVSHGDILEEDSFNSTNVPPTTGMPQTMQNVSIYLFIYRSVYLLI